MSAPRSEFVRQLVARGFVHQATDLEGIDALAADGRLVGYIGFDCTADSLHIGNLVSIMLLRWLQQTGQRPIALIGGGTSKVGDPSGKDESRQLLDDATLAANLAGVRRSLASFLEFGDGPGQALLVNNDDWLQPPRLHRLPARLRPPLHDQPHADLRLGAPAARARAAADLPRVQLHGHAGLRLPRARAAPRLPAAARRLGPVGQHRQRRRARPPRRRAASSTA